MPEAVSGYYVWEAAGKSATVQLSLDLIDRLSTVVMTGFGAIPRRGAEVGGILIGCVLPGGTTTRIDEFEAVPCSYKRGPSYLFADSDSAAFREAWDKWKPESGKTQYAVGYYRSNTRDQATVSDEDRALCESYFPAPSNVMLFIKPYASKVTTAGFITYENGKLDDESALEFPFRRFEIEGTAPPARRPLGERMQPRLVRRDLAGGDAAAPADAASMTAYPAAQPSESQPQSFGYERPYAVTAESRSAGRGWVWIPMSFIFLLLGVLLGFQSALSIYPSRSGARVNPGEDPYSMKLAVTKTADTLQLKWDREAPMFRLVQRGQLFIQDGETIKEVELDSVQLQSGIVIYKRLSKRVQFRLEVRTPRRLTVSESVEWRE